jgi:hypothetical protein
MKRLLAVAILCLAGCATETNRPPARDATEVLVNRPDFKDAAKAAPDWVRAALQEITSLESKLETAKR